MNLHCFTLQDLTQEATLRCDAKYLAQDRIASEEDCYTFNDLFSLVDDDKVNIENLADVDFEYVEIGDVTSANDIVPVSLNFSYRNELNENYFAKIEKGDIIKATPGDILISKVRPYLKKIILIDEKSSKYYYTSAFVHIRPKRSNLLLYYALKTVFIDNLNCLSREGKGYPTLNERDLKYLKLNKQYLDLLFKNENKLLPIINNKISEIAIIKNQIINEKDIINKTFIDFFNWNIKGFEKEKSQKKFKINMSDISSNYDLRFSPKFHRPAGEYVLKEINKNNCKRIKEYLSDPIVLGASVSPSDFDDNGEYYYLSMASIKNWVVELDDTQLLSSHYTSIEKNFNKKVEKGDIIMSRSGVAIGKFAIVNEDINAIHSDFTMRIRLKNINIHFSYYYFRSIFFQYLIEVNYKGMQNNNIFPNQIQDFIIPEISDEEQSLIANQIYNEIEIQNNYRKKIKELQNSIATIFIEYGINKYHIVPGSV